MTTQLYLQKAEIQLAKDLEVKVLESFWQLLIFRMMISSAKHKRVVL